MSVKAPTHPLAVPRPMRPGSLGVAVVVGVLAAAVLGVWQPAAGIGLALVALVGALIRNVPLPRLGRAVVVLAAVAAILGPNLALPAAPEVFAFRILIVLLGIGVVGYALMGGTIVLPAGLGRPGGILVLLWLWSALSIGWADDVLAAVRWVAFMAMMAGLAIGIALLCRSRRRAVILLWTLAVTFGVAILFGLAEFLVGYRLPTSALLGKTREAAFGITSLFGNQNNFATYLTLTLPYFLVLPVVYRDVRLRVLGLVGAGAALLALLWTGSKSNLLAAGLVLIALLLIVGADRRARERIVGAVAIAVLAVLLVVPTVLGGGIVPLPQQAVTKFDFGLLSAQVDAQTGSGAVRSSLLDDGLNLVAETHGLGVGAGNAESRVRSLAAFPGVANLHNWWLEVLVNTGIVGFALYLAFYLTLLRGQLRAARTSPDPLVRYMGLAGGLALVGYIAGSLGPSTAIHFAPMWIAFGLGMGTLVLARRAGTRA